MAESNMYLENEQMGLSQIVELPRKQEEKLKSIVLFHGMAGLQIFF